MLSLISLGVHNLDRARRFYDAALACLGYVRLWADDKALGYGVAGGEEALALKLRPDGPVAAPGDSGFHLALAAPSPEAVDAFHAAALAFGGTSVGEPGPRPHYGAGYYAAFVVDVDGHKLEAVHQS